MHRYFCAVFIIILCQATQCFGQNTGGNALPDISSVLPSSRISGDVILPSGEFFGDMNISLPARISAKKLGDFILRGRITVKAEGVVLENIVIDGSRQDISNGNPAGGKMAVKEIPVLLSIGKSKNVIVRNCVIIGFDQPLSLSQLPSVCQDNSWGTRGIRISDSENVTVENTRIATGNSRIQAVKSKNIRLSGNDFCAATAVGSQYKLFLRIAEIYALEPDSFQNISELEILNNVFRAAGRHQQILNFKGISGLKSDGNVFWGTISPPLGSGGSQWDVALARTLQTWREMSGQDLNSRMARIDYITDKLLGFKRDPEGVLTGRPNISMRLPEKSQASDGAAVSSGVFREDGSLVRTLLAEYETKGLNVLNLHWDGTDNLRKTVEPGRYVVKAMAPNLEVEQTWLGNSYGTFDGHVQMEILGISTTPDGTTFGICEWEEAGAEIKGYTADGRSDFESNPDLHGWGRGGSSEIAVDEKYVYAGISQKGGYKHPAKNKNGLLAFPEPGKIWFGLRRYSLPEMKTVPFPEGYQWDEGMLLLGEEYCIGGIAAGNGKVYVSNFKLDKLIEFDRDTLKQLRVWGIRNPGRIALDGKGSAWILEHLEPNAIPNGNSSVCRVNLKDASSVIFKLEDVENTSAIAFNQMGRLLIGDNGADMQVKIYDVSGASPKLVDALGQKGGIYADKPGIVAPDKLNGITGIGVDSSGNVYVSSTRSGGELRKFSQDKKLQWHLMGLAFVDGASADPDSPEDVFMKDEHFKMDYSAHPAKWEYVAYTRDIRRPDPFSVQRSKLASNLIRRIAGKRFMFCSPMYAQELAIFKFDGEIAVPSGYIGVNDKKIWRDMNGDGIKDEAECEEIDPKFLKSSWHWFVATNGDIWRACNDAGIMHIPCQGLDDKGNPVYEVSKTEIIPMPSPFIEINTVEYIPETDTLYVGGETEMSKRNKGDGWGPTTRFIARYDNKTKLRWLAPVDTICCNAISVSSKIVAAVDVRTAQIQMFDTSTGLKLGTAAAGKPVGYHSGWTDFPMCIRAMTLKNGETVVLAEEDSCAKIMIYRVKADSRELDRVPLDVDDKGKVNSIK
jgi:hypothetical protein